MDMAIERPSTPPPSGLTLPLTPPPTGGVNKRVRFVDGEQAKTSTRHLTKNKEGESPDTFFGDLQEGFETGLHSNSETESNPSTPSPAASPPASTTSASPTRTVLSKHDGFTSLALAIDTPLTTTSPFPFLSLPIAIRKRIYEHLLVTPGLLFVRQNHTTFHDEKKAFLYTSHRAFLPGIAYALAQLTVDGPKTRFSHFTYTNINILLASKEVYNEAKLVLYGMNRFEIVKPSMELYPSPDYSVRLFPMGCQRLVTRLHMRIRSFYDLCWLLQGGGYNLLKKYYRGMEVLTLILELGATRKGFGRVWVRGEGEEWQAYVDRLRGEMEKELFRKNKGGNAKVVPLWMNLCVLFSGESYDGDTSAGAAASAGAEAVERAKRDELRRGLVETWELFKKGGK